MVRRSSPWFRLHRATPGYLLLCLSLLLIGVKGLSAAPPKEGPPPAVTVLQVEEIEANPPSEYVGRMQAIQAVDLRARVEGFLEKVAFQEGAEVEVGDLLYVIEQAPYKARLEEARAKVAQAEAGLTRAKQYLQRLKTVSTGGVSATDLDAAVTNELQASAQLQEARANLEQAQLNLDYTTIRAPIRGRIGRTAFTQGNLVGPASEALARIVQMDPIRAVYSLSENDLATESADTKAIDPQRMQTRLVPRLKLPGGEILPQVGHIDFIDNQVDPATGTIAVWALFPNPGGALLPGQYVTVQVRLKEARRLPAVPQAAVMEDRKGRYVFVVDETNTAQLRRIDTGPAVETQWTVESGLRTGETIIVHGVQKVKPGQTVQPSTNDSPTKE